MPNLHDNVSSFKGRKNLYVCCGKFLCYGCYHYMLREECPFCNGLAPEDDEEVKEMLMKRINRFNDAHAMINLGSCYERGHNGFVIDELKAMVSTRERAWMC